MEIGETFDFQLTLLPDNRHRLHVNIDLLIMDASSFTLFFDELNALLAGESLPAIDTRYDFRSYLLHQQKINQPLRDDARLLAGESIDASPRPSCRWPANPPRYVKSVIPDAA